jgi:RimJ/RimL family protein N-acetyltransferase
MPIDPPKPPLSDGIITLRPFNADDLEPVERALADPEIGRRFGKSKLTAVEFIAGKQRGWSQGDAAAFAVCDVHSTFVGQVFVEPGEARTAEIGYWVLPEGRGRGHAVRAVRLASRWALAELGVARLELWTETNNVRSQHVAERSGFIREGVLRSFREVEGRRFDAILYSLLPSDPLH